MFLSGRLNSGAIEHPGAAGGLMVRFMLLPIDAKLCSACEQSRVTAASRGVPLAQGP